MFEKTRLLRWMSWWLQLAAWFLHRTTALRFKVPRASPTWSSLDAAHLSTAAHNSNRLCTVAAARALSWSIRGALLAGVAGLSAVAALAANAWLQPTEWTDQARWRQLLDAKLQQLVVDRDNRVVGLSNQRSVPNAGGAATVTDTCIDLVLAQEDRHHAEAWRRFRGVDVPALSWALLGRRGASTVPMQLVRVAADLSDDAGVATRKSRELAAAGVLLDIYGGDVRRLAADYLLLAPFALALGRGGTINGLPAFADAVFAKAADQMTPAECAVAVASLPSPLWLNDAGDRARTRHNRVTARAVGGLRDLGLDNAASRAELAVFDNRFPIYGEALARRSARDLAPLRPILNAQALPSREPSP